MTTRFHGHAPAVGDGVLHAADEKEPAQRHHDDWLDGERQRAAHDTERARANDEPDDDPLHAGRQSHPTHRTLAAYEEAAEVRDEQQTHEEEKRAHVVTSCCGRR